MKKRILLLSDLWGKEKSDWIIHYKKVLEPLFDVVYYDCCELGEIDKSDYTQDNLHQQFVQGGIEKTVEALSKKEQGVFSILAFSIGGVIAWRLALERGTIDNLICVSSTRLRYETEKPVGNIRLYFGEFDTYQPKIEWLDNMAVPHQIVPNAKHELYRDAIFAEEIGETMMTMVIPK